MLHRPVCQWFFVTLESGDNGGKHVVTVWWVARKRHLLFVQFRNIPIHVWRLRTLSSNRIAVMIVCVCDVGCRWNLSLFSILLCLAWWDRRSKKAFMEMIHIFKITFLAWFIVKTVFFLDIYRRDCFPCFSFLTFSCIHKCFLASSVPHWYPVVWVIGQLSWNGGGRGEGGVSVKDDVFVKLWKWRWQMSFVEWSRREVWPNIVHVLVWFVAVSQTNFIVWLVVPQLHPTGVFPVLLPPLPGTYVRTINFLHSVLTLSTLFFVFRTFFCRSTSLPASMTSFCSEEQEQRELQLKARMGILLLPPGKVNERGRGAAFSPLFNSLLAPFFLITEARGSVTYRDGRCEENRERN